MLLRRGTWAKPQQCLTLKLIKFCILYFVLTQCVHFWLKRAEGTDTSLHSYKVRLIITALLTELKAEATTVSLRGDEIDGTYANVTPQPQNRGQFTWQAAHTFSPRMRNAKGGSDLSSRLVQSTSEPQDSQNHRDRPCLITLNQTKPQRSMLAHKHWRQGLKTLRCVRSATHRTQILYDSIRRPL